MEIEQLSAFLEVARTKNFTRAAEALNVVQSTITARIQMLERSIGKNLFNRKTRRVELTAAGEALVPYAEQVMESIKGGLDAVRLQPDYESRFVVGGLNSIWDSSLLTSILQFKKHQHEMAFRLVTDHSDHLSVQVQCGNIDAAFVYIPPRFSSLEVVPIKEEVVQLVGKPSLVKKIGSVHTNQLVHLPYIHINWGPPFTEWFEHEVGSHDAVAFRIDHTGVAVNLLLSGEGIGFLLDSIAEKYIENGQLAYLTIQSKHVMPKRIIYMIYDKKNRQIDKINALLGKTKNPSLSN